ncbi:hypothetical protein ACFE04_004766 [Oxalis oulophora]
MGTEILRPHDCLTERIRSSSPSSSSVFVNPRPRYNNNNGNQPQSHHAFNYYFAPNRKPSRRFNQPLSRRSSSVDDLKLSRNSADDHFTVEKSALRRVESHHKVNGKPDVLYAGSAFAVSPAPSSLPLPSFSTTTTMTKNNSCVDDSATKDLRRLLRLDM